MSAQADDGQRAREPRPPGRRWLRRILIVLASTAAAFLVAELALRAVLFSDAELLAPLRRVLGREALYAHTTESDYFKLSTIFHRDQAFEVSRPDTKLGWVATFDARTFEHPDESRIGARRPVLLYGDSNAQCMTAPELCFQGILERSDLSDRYALLNYGVAGYGLDQIYMTVRGSIDRFAARDPVVVIAILVEDDLARSILDFRGWPKPVFGVRDGHLVEPAEVDVDTRRYLDEHPPEINSYVARLVARRLMGPRGAELERLEEVNRLLLEALRDELEARHLDYFFVLFGFDASIVQTPVERASRSVLDRFFERHRAPNLDVLEFIRAICDPEWHCLDELIGRNDPVLLGHLNDGGNRLAFEAIRQGLEGRFDGPDVERLRGLAREGVFRPDPENTPWSSLLGRPARPVSGSLEPISRWNPAVRTGPLPRLGLCAADERGTRFEIRLEPAASRLTARVRTVRLGSGASGSSSARLVVTVDGVEVLRREYASGADPEQLSLDVSTKRELVLRVEAIGAPSTDTWLELLDFDLVP